MNVLGWIILVIGLIGFAVVALNTPRDYNLKNLKSKIVLAIGTAFGLMTFLGTTIISMY